MNPWPNGKYPGSWTSSRHTTTTKVSTLDRSGNPHLIPAWFVYLNVAFKDAASCTAETCCLFTLKFQPLSCGRLLFEPGFSVLFLPSPPSAIIPTKVVQDEREGGAFLRIVARASGSAAQNKEVNKQTGRHCATGINTDLAGP